jgi:ankyrin repeat protein
VEILIEKEAKLNVLNKCQDTPLHCACQKNHLDIALLLLKNKGNSVNSVNIHGNTPLHYACHFRFISLAKELVRHGALVNLCNRYNKTPIDLLPKQFKPVIESKYCLEYYL